MRPIVIFVTLGAGLLSACACTGDLSASADSGVVADAALTLDAELARADAQAALPSLAFVMPAEGSTQVRDTVVS